jgi:hypothetical protein
VSRYRTTQCGAGARFAVFSTAQPGNPYRGAPGVPEAGNIGSQRYEFRLPRVCKKNTRPDGGSGNVGMPSLKKSDSNNGCFFAKNRLAINEFISVLRYSNIREILLIASVMHGAQFVSDYV